ncbi:HYR domain-containing protein [Anaeromyxobacter oryzae]|uniref:HYR domain-containing protein n=1 Tax=Anaeromyxobacter oryzae TaxID=2918170 RepID=A0ABN6MX07_9BACT|nr:HYR domain-containing protein [Anaeromyxobacter oryzae]BDG05421.1 hypothetical protein AMOR_44170 [Anaeromyxobacter oryzae]
MSRSSLFALAVLVSTTSVQAQDAGGPGHASALLPDQTVVVIGGTGADGTPTGATLTYAPLDAAGSPAGALGVPRAYHSATSLYDGRIVVIGGNDGAGAIGSIELFDPLLNGFRPSAATLAAPRQQHQAIALADGRVLVRGGRDGAVPVTTDEVYDPRTDTIGPAPAGLAVATVTTDRPDYLPGDTVYVSGAGFAPGETVLLLIDEEPLQHVPRVFTSVANDRGEVWDFTTLLVEPRDLGASFTLHAVGASSGLTADVGFTDGAVLQVTGLPGSLSLVVGDVQTFTFRISTKKDAPFRNVQVSVALPAGLEGASAIPPPFDLGAGADVTFPFAVRAAAPASGTITIGVAGTSANPAVVCSDKNDPCSDAKTLGFTVTARSDTTPPVVTVPGDMTVEAASRDGALVTFSSSATDDVSGSVPVTCTPPSGGTFALATTTVTCRANDAAGNTGTASFTITVRDTTRPTFGVLPAPVVEATGPDGAAVDFGAVKATDAVDGEITATCVPASGTTFAVGNTEVTCTAADHATNAATARFTVTVRDTTPPAFGALPAPVVEATGPAGAVVDFGTVKATDLVDGEITATCTPGSGTTFAVGRTQVTCTATDRATNSAAATFTVTVRDTTPPAFGALPAPVVEATGPGGALVDYGAVKATDVVDGEVTATCTPASNTTFALGKTEVTCTAADRATNSATAKFTVTVRDTTPPIFGALPAPVVEATGPNGAVVTYGVVDAADLVDGTVVASCSPASGSTFALGATPVSCTATDRAGNSAPATFTVTVRDTTPPAISAPPDLVVEATAATGAVVAYADVYATDLVSGVSKASCTQASGSTFAPGVTVVTCAATDGAGNTGHASFDVWVQFSWSGLLQPIGRENNSAFKAGSTIPVKFTLDGASAGVTELRAAIAVFRVGNEPTGTALEDVTETVPDTGTLFRHDSGQYIYNLSTKGYVGGDYWIYVNLGDGLARATKISLRK